MGEQAKKFERDEAQEKVLKLEEELEALAVPRQSIVVQGVPPSCAECP